MYLYTNRDSVATDRIQDKEVKITNVKNIDTETAGKRSRHIRRIKSGAGQA
jgi:hypothetical protein